MFVNVLVAKNHWIINYAKINFQLIDKINLTFPYIEKKRWRIPGIA